MDLRLYSVLRRKREPLRRFIHDALAAAGCRILCSSEAHLAPFRISFETPVGERMGVVAYAFLANSKVTNGRPRDEHRFQVKSGTDDKQLHAIWQDPYLVYTTLLCGIDPERGIFVGADPVLHNPTRFFRSIEYKQAQVEEIRRLGWYAWERDRRAGAQEPVEVLVGGTASSFLRYLFFEREAVGEDQGHRQLLAERADQQRGSADLRWVANAGTLIVPAPVRLHALAREFEMSETEVLDLIGRARRLKMAVRGWVAEEHLVRELQKIPGVTECARNDEEGRPDIDLRFEGSPVTVECKNVLRQTNAAGLARVDFQRTRAAKSDPCSRYYGPGDFAVLAACLHAVTEHWEFSYALPRLLDTHKKCPGKLSSAVRVDERWTSDAREILSLAAGGRTDVIPTD